MSRIPIAVIRRGRRTGVRLRSIQQEENQMTIRDMIPWNRGGNPSTRRGEETNPFMALHREVNRLFDDAFRGFDMAPFGQNGFGRGMSWPHIELSDTDKEVKVKAELPGLDEQDVQVELTNGVLVIKGEKK